MSDNNLQDSSKTLLIVDDNKSILDYLKAHLGNHGYKIQTAQHAKEALAKTQNQHPNFALIDIRLPDVNGVELSKQISSLLPEIIIILMTGYPSVKNALQNHEDRIFDYLIKPFKIEQVLMSLKRSVKYSRLIEQNNKYKEEIKSLHQDNKELQIKIRKLMGKTTNKGNQAIQKSPKNRYLDSYKKHQDYSDE